MIVRLPPAIGEALPRLAARAAPGEACALLIGRAAAAAILVSGLAPSRNLAAEADAFEIDTSLRLQLQRQVRREGESVVGIWHSHPIGTATPSPRDAAGAWEPGLIWLITAHGTTTAWMARGEGAGFDRVELAAG